MEQTKERHWRRWVVLALMILGFFLAYFVGGIFTPVMPYISVAPEKILLKPIVPNFLGTGPLYLTNTLTTLIVTLILIFILRILHQPFAEEEPGHRSGAAWRWQCHGSHPGNALQPD